MICSGAKFHFLKDTLQKVRCLLRHPAILFYFLWRQVGVMAKCFLRIPLPLKFLCFFYPFTDHCRRIRFLAGAIFLQMMILQRHCFRTDINPVQQRPANPAQISSHLPRSAVTLFTVWIPSTTARVHGSHQKRMRRIPAASPKSRHMDPSIFQWLTKDLQSISLKLRKLIQK